MRKTTGRTTLLSACLLSMVAIASADVAPDEPGPPRTLPQEVGEHWVWVPDRVLRRTALFDGNTGDMLGMLDTGLIVGSKPPQWSEKRGEIYNVDTLYTRMHHGERKDFVFIYDARTLAIIGEIEVPPRVGDPVTGIATVGMLEGDRFLVILNQLPGSSVTVVDLEERRFVTEIQTAGCAGVYPAGPRGVGMLCGNGTAIALHLTDEGELDRITRSEPFFDVVTDPVSEKGTPNGSRWIYTTFGGQVYEIDYAGEAPQVASTWSLFTNGERDDGWRVGGSQYLTYHAPTHRLYAIVHQGGPGSHKDPGGEVWVWNASTQSRVAKFTMPNVLVPFIRPQVGFEAGGFVDWLLRKVLPDGGVHSIAVTRDDNPLLFVRSEELGAVGVVDAMTGEHLRDLEEVGLNGALLVVP